MAYLTNTKEVTTPSEKQLNLAELVDIFANVITQHSWPEKIETTMFEWHDIVVELEKFSKHWDHPTFWNEIIASVASHLISNSSNEEIQAWPREKSLYDHIENMIDDLREKLTEPEPTR